MQSLHLLSGLPRSGSTLLAGILRQNPRIHAAMSSPVCGLIRANHMVMTGPEASVFMDEARRRTVLRAIVEAYYRDMPQSVVVDTSRGWTSQLPVILALYPDARIVCTVRSVAWIMDSIERLTRGQPFERSRLWSDAERSSVFTRCEALAKSDRLVGSSWCGLREALASEYRGRILLVEYDDLARDPAGQMERIYLHIGEQPFGHDFDNVDYAEPEFDAQLSTPGLHTVKRRVERIERKTILPDELFRKFDSLSAWRAPP